MFTADYQTVRIFPHYRLEMANKIVKAFKKTISHLHLYVRHVRRRRRRGGRPRRGPAAAGHVRGGGRGRGGPRVHALVALLPLAAGVVVVVELGRVPLLVRQEEVLRHLARAVARDLLGALLVRVVAAVLALDALHKKEKKIWTLHTF